ncbi:MAG: DNA-methyltransferase [Candidatus Thorarchaeota archaeon]|jgi:site-specific DNA-methyltransferase (adenine-specific)
MDIADQLWRVTKKGGVLVWVVADATNKGTESGTSFKQALYFKDIGFRLHDTMIYEKKNYVPLTHNRYEQAFEYMFVLSKGKPKTWNAIMIPTIDANHLHDAKFVRSSTYASTQEKGSAMRSGKRRKEHETYRTKDTKQKSNIWSYSIGSTHTGDQLAYRHPASFPERLALDHITSWSNPGDLVFDPMCGSGTVLKMALQAHRHYLGFDIAAEYVVLSKRRISQVQVALF